MLFQWMVWFAIAARVVFDTSAELDTWPLGLLGQNHTTSAGWGRLQRRLCQGRDKDSLFLLYWLLNVSERGKVYLLLLLLLLLLFLLLHLPLLLFLILLLTILLLFLPLHLLLPSLSSSSSSAYSHPIFFFSFIPYLELWGSVFWWDFCTCDCLASKYSCLRDLSLEYSVATNSQQFLSLNSKVK